MDAWRDSRCPICLDHPHNAVLLICPSHNNGCRPFICDTTDLLSDCFRHYCRLKSVVPSECLRSKLNDFPLYLLSGQQELACPLCRGRISGWMVNESAREFMNGLVRGCSVDWCEFSGNYCDSEKHAESEHPDEVPVVVVVDDDASDLDASDLDLPGENDLDVEIFGVGSSLNLPELYADQADLLRDDFDLDSDLGEMDLDLVCTMFSDLDDMDSPDPDVSDLDGDSRFYDANLDFSPESDAWFVENLDFC